MKLIQSLLAGILMAVTGLVYGQSIDLNTAKVVARNHLLSVGSNQLKSASLNRTKPQFTSHSVTSESKDTLYFVLNDTINHRFVIVSGDKRSTPIIGYSLEGNFDVNNQPPAFAAWMKGREKEIAYIKQNNLQADSKISEQWDNLISANAQEKTENTGVEPLLKTKWDQGCYYNSLCPQDFIINSCGRVPTGCTATAMAQIMKYWNYPTKGTGSHTYLTPGYGILSADFGATTYQWSQMPNEVTSENDAVAKLMYHCGVAVDMNYDPEGSGAYDPRDEMVKYFNYSAFAENVDKRSFLPEDWVNLLKSELNEGRPIWYTGTDNLCGGKGHAFVCDGYQDTDYFHFNWGWGGAFDGYFYLENLNPGGESFTIYQSAVIKIFPNSLPDGYEGILLSTKTVGIGVNGGTAKVDISSNKEWTVSSDQTWLTFTSEAGTIGSHSIIFTTTANPTSDNRQAKVTISAAGLPSQTIIVTQYSNVEVTAGNLKTNLGSQLSTITSLNLKGTIDARDFRIMRDEMPALTEIDLSDVTIASYTGTAGTIGDESYSYPPNTIPNYAFLYPASNRAKSRLQSIVLPSSITSINDYAFQGCKNLSIQNIPGSVTSIGNGAFAECNLSKSLTIPSSVTFIGNAAFKNFKGEIKVDAYNPNYSSLDGVLFNKTQTKLIQCPISKIGEYIIPSSVTSIGGAAFFDCGNLTAVSIPTSVITIENYAFNYCSGLTSITIPSSVTSIGERVFDGFKGLISVDANNPKYSALEGVLFNKDQTELIQCPVSKAGTYTIPSTVTTVKADAFHECVNISSLIIPGSVKNIGAMALNLVRLSSVYAYSLPPIDLTSSYKAFVQVNTSRCILYIPNGTRALYESANQWQLFLNMVEMPGFSISDKTIDIAMNGGTALLNIASNTDWSVSADQTWLTISSLSGTAGCHKITLTAPANTTMYPRKTTLTVSATGYESRTIEVTQYAIVKVTAGNLKTILGSKLFTRKSLNLTGTIDARDFRTMRDKMPALTDIDLSNVSIAEYTGTEGTEGNYNITYPSDMIPYQAFFNSSISRAKNSLKSIVLPPSAKRIGNYAFARNTGLKAINIPSFITTIENQAFESFNGVIIVAAENPNYLSRDSILFNKAQTTIIQCSGSKTGAYTIPSSVTNLNNDAFNNCSGLTQISLPSSVTTLGEGVFIYCSGLTSLNIPSSINILPQNAFAYCRKLNSITIPSSVNTINSWAFLGCDGLNSIYASAMTPVDLSRSTGVFDSVNKISCTLYVPSGTKGLYASANQWKDFTNIVEINSPVAHAGDDLQAEENRLVTLDGSASSDPENGPLTYFWTAPDGIVLDTDTIANPTFTVPEVGKDTSYTFALTVFDGKMYSTADLVVVSVKNVDKAPYVKSTTNDISVDITSPDQIIDLQDIFADDDLNDVLSYCITSNTNEQVVKTEVSGCYLTLSFSSQQTGKSEMVITANSNGKEVSYKFNVEVKIPTEINSFARDQKLKVFPNPTNGKVKVKINQTQQISKELIVTDIKGRPILRKVIHEKEEWVDLTGHEPGTYLIKINSDNTIVQKVILK